MNVSVIVPVYNCEKYLEQCLESLKAQQLNDIEILVVDDGSTDNSKLIMEKYKQFPSFVMLYKENGGVSSARNYALQFAKGQYVGFVDADDWVESNMFSEMFYAAKNNAFPDIVQCNYVRNQNENVSRQSINKGYYDEKAIGEKIIPQILSYIDSKGNIKSMSPYNWLRLYSRDLIVENKIYFDERISNGEDRLFNTQMILAAKSYYYLGDESTYYHYRYNPSSQSLSYKSYMWQQRQLCFEKLIEIGNSTKNDAFINQVHLHIYAASIYCLWNELKRMYPKKECISRIFGILDNPMQELWKDLELNKKLNKKNLKYYKFFINKNAKRLYRSVYLSRKKKQIIAAIRKIFRK